AQPPLLGPRPAQDQRVLHREQQVKPGAEDQGDHRQAGEGVGHRQQPQPQRQQQDGPGAQHRRRDGDGGGGQDHGQQARDLPDPLQPAQGAAAHAQFLVEIVLEHGAVSAEAELPEEGGHSHQQQRLQPPQAAQTSTWPPAPVRMAAGAAKRARSAASPAGTPRRLSRWATMRSPWKRPFSMKIRLASYPAASTPATYTPGTLVSMV